MKYSQYNTIINITDKTFIIYNALSDHFLLISIDKKEILTDINYLEQNDTRLFNLLREGGFVIEKNIYELDEVKELSKKIDSSTSSYHLIVNPTINCNFNCWYCYETHNSSMMSEETIQQVGEFILKKVNNIQHFALSFFGGEPLLGYEKVVKPIILKTKEICNQNNVPFSISFTTNGYLLNEEMIKFFKENKVISLQITLDGGKIEHNKTRFLKNGTGSYDKIINNIKLSLQNGISIHLRINYTNNNILSCNEIAYDLKDISTEMKSYLKVYFQKVWQSEETKDTNEQVKAMIGLFQSFDLKTDIYIYDNVRKPCYGDKLNSAVINYNGDVYKCTAIDFEKTKREGFLSKDGDIRWENDSLNIRLNSKFKNESCLSCRILPICNGACTQKALEYKDTDYCILHYHEEEKDDAVLARFKSSIVNNPEWQKITT